MTKAGQHVEVLFAAARAHLDPHNTWGTKMVDHIRTVIAATLTDGEPVDARVVAKAVFRALGAPTERPAGRQTVYFGRMVRAIQRALPEADRG
ncbi:hypothetical protein N8J89_07960 [Crossiella sp. CA-258035]|uniref:hypothetical protein n=1 Tax=Crossiella sp. CA-258035 TaxID=2981138 RepID=UPI0024BD5215|nr:hypothetical protein [Crossiella sp. CA-258035]WHT20989.1 hypothetical protein N8J89_07960 [Crossiella sp. CA-258035]